MNNTDTLKQIFTCQFGIPTECWQVIEKNLYPQDLFKGAYFSTEGCYSKTLGFLTSGVVRIFYRKESGEEYTKHFLSKHEFLAASIKPGEKSITYSQALTNCNLLCIDYDFFMNLSKQYSEINNFISTKTFEYLEQKQNREIRLLSEDATGNYLDFLNRFPGLIDLIPHYYIAGYLGVSPTQLSRLRKKLEKM
ncbi:MAG: Crp/Fnr family transcriptional regulator [Bacteroidales bacterium]|nr:Crp/Fnr family transcriptional regulator [Bacteroidales bacterium]